MLCFISKICPTISELEDSEHEHLQLPREENQVLVPNSNTEIIKRGELILSPHWLSSGIQSINMALVILEWQSPVELKVSGAEAVACKHVHYRHVFKTETTEKN